jgi:hypothetical protein
MEEFRFLLSEEIFLYPYENNQKKIKTISIYTIKTTYH